MYALGFMMGIAIIVCAYILVRRIRFNVRNDIKERCRRGAMPINFVLQQNEAGLYRYKIKDRDWSSARSCHSYSKKRVIRAAWVHKAEDDKATAKYERNYVYENVT